MSANRIRPARSGWIKDLKIEGGYGLDPGWAWEEGILDERQERQDASGSLPSLKGFLAVPTPLPFLRRCL